MSELLTAAAQALNAPEAIVKRSAEARAKAGGVAVDDVLSAWSGGGTVVPSATDAPPPESSPTNAPTEAAPATTAAAEPAPATTAAAEPVPEVEIPEPSPPEPEEIPAAPLRERVRVAGRVGALSGGVLGLIGTLVGSPWLVPSASVVGSEGSYSPAVEVDTSMFLVATVLLSMLFGLIVAGLARVIPGWLHPGMRLGGSSRTSAFIGIGSGLVLGAIGGGVLTSAFGVPLEGVEGRVTLPLMSAVLAAIIGGAVLGWLTAVFVQAVGVPAHVSKEEATEVSQVRGRLGSAISVPLAGIIALSVLVLPFAFVLIESNHLASGGASILAIITSASILSIAGLSASRPGMKITRGEFLLALTGIGVVVTIIVAVFLARSTPHDEEEGEHAEAAVWIAGT